LSAGYRSARGGDHCDCHCSWNGALSFSHQAKGCRRLYDLQSQLGSALLLGLEFLVAADIIRTVALETTTQNVIILGLLVIVRTFLSWSLVVEIEGRWRSADGRDTKSIQ